MSDPRAFALLAEFGNLSAVWVIVGYLLLLLGLGVWSSSLSRGTASDYFVANRSIGSFLLLMSLFGTTMTAFAMVGSTAKAFDKGIGVYGLMASSSGLVHSLVFFTVGIRLWAVGKRFGFVTQIEYFRARYESSMLGYLLFPILVSLVVVYVLVGMIGASTVLRGVTLGAFPAWFPETGGAVPRWISGLVISGVVLFYIFYGGLRGAAFANAFQTIVFMAAGIVAFALIARALGGAAHATELVAEKAPAHLAREGLMGHGQFLSYMLVPLSVGMFPHVFQHWLTAKSAKSFRLAIVAHPLFILIVWVPCILIGLWAQAAPGVAVPTGRSNLVLSSMVNTLIQDPWITGLLSAGILAAIMSSLDSQFVCLGTMFTRDVIVHTWGKQRISDRAELLLGRGFVVAVVAICYGLSLLDPPHLFDLGVWCFSGFTALFPLVVAALFWRRATRAGALACVLVTAASWSLAFREGMLSAPARPGADQEDFLILSLMPVAWLLLLSSATLVLVSLFTRPPSPAVVRKFFPTQRTAS